MIRFRKLSIVGVVSAVLVSAFVAPASAAAGHLDRSFSGDGKLVINSSPGGDEAHDVVVQPNGKIVFLVNVDQSGSKQRFGVYRLRPNGTLDTTFNGTGKHLFNFGPASTLWADAVALTPAGRIVVAGRTSASGGGYAFARLLPNGKLDSTFGTGGKAVIPPSTGEAVSLAVQQDGKIVFGGRSGNPCCGVVGRLTTRGKLDKTFGNNGTQDVTWGQSNAALFSVAIRPSGKIVAAGSACPSSCDVGLAQLTSSGAFDNASFNPPFGEETTDFGASDAAYSVALQNGKIVIGGSRSTNSDDKALFARYETNGLLDSSFGSNGHVFANVGDGSADDLAVSGSGKLLAVGPWSQSNTALGFFLIRRQANGHPDLSFGNSGIVKPRGTYDGSPAVAIQPDGRIVVAEATNGNGAPKDVFVARFLAS